MANGALLGKKRAAVVRARGRRFNLRQQLINNRLPFRLKREEFDGALADACVLVRDQLLAHARAQLDRRKLVALDSLEQFLNGLLAAGQSVENLGPQTVRIFFPVLEEGRGDLGTLDLS